MMDWLECNCKAVQYDREKIIKRKERLYDKIYAEFPPCDSQYFATMTLMDIYFPRTIQMILIGNNALVYLEIYAVLEFFLLSYLPDKLAKHDKARKIIAKQLERKNLPELAQAAQALGLWSKDDLSFIGTLAGIRNALAHRNYNLLHKVLGAPKLDPFDFRRKFDSKIEDRDSFGDFVRSLRLIIKFTKHKRKSAANKKKTESDAQVAILGN